MELRHILTILAVRDLEKTATFYEAAFGWEPQVQVPVYREYSIGQDHRLGLYDHEAFKANTGKAPQFPTAGSVSATELYFQTQDLERAMNRLEKAGAELLAPLQVKDWGDEAAYFADPEGNVIVLSRPLHEDG